MEQIALIVSPEEYKTIITGLMELKARESMHLILNLAEQKNQQEKKE